MDSQTSLFDLLKQDHAEVTNLFRQLESMEDSGLRQHLFDEMREDLELHSLAEEETIYPGLEEFEEAEPVVAEAQEQHNRMRDLMELVSSIDPEDPEWEVRARELGLAIEDHVKMEESRIFEKMGEFFDETTMKTMRDRFLAAKSNLGAHAA